MLKYLSYINCKNGLFVGCIAVIGYLLPASMVSAAPLSSWYDNSENFAINHSSVLRGRRSKDVEMRFNLRNISKAEIQRPYRLAFENLTSGVIVEGAKLQEDGTQYLDLDYIIGDKFDAKAVLPNLKVKFLNVGSQDISFQTKIYSPEYIAHDGCTKTKTVQGVKFCLKVRTNNVGHFTNATVARWDPNTNRYQTPKLVLTADDLWDKGDRSHDFTQSLLRSMKWFTCPSTGKSSFYSKRHNIGDNGEYKPTRDLLRATVLHPEGQFDSPWTDAIHVGKPYGFSSGDLGDFNDGKNKYIVTAEADEIMIMQLETDCSDVLATPDNMPLMKTKWFKDNGSVDKREAPAVFKIDDMWYLHTSGKTGWRPNQHKYATANELKGPWSEMIEIGDATGYHSQAFYIGSHQGNKLFPGTRNSQIVPGGLGHKGIVLPIYVNKAGVLNTAYYDLIEKTNDGRVIGHQKDHGQKLSIINAEIPGNKYVNPYELIDDDLSSAWMTSDTNIKQVLFDLGESHLIKAIKVRNFNFVGLWNNWISDFKIEVGDDSGNWVTVWDNWILMMDWLQPLDIKNIQGQYVRFTHKQTRRTNQNDIRNHWGFYQVEFWGDNAREGHVVSEDFESGTLENWSVESNGSSTSVDLISVEGGYVANLTDSSENNRAKLIQRFTPQTGSEVSVELRVKVGRLGSGEFIRLLGSTDIAWEIVNSPVTNSLSVVLANGQHEKIANVAVGEWIDLKVNANLDAHTFDVFVNDKVVWGGEWLINKVQYVDGLTVSSSNVGVGANLYVDNIVVKGPLTLGVYNKPEKPAIPEIPFFTDDFDDGYDTNLWSNFNWTQATYQDSKAVQSDIYDSITSRGEKDWRNYTVSADVRRTGKMAMLLGRVSADNSTYYQLAIRRDSKDIVLQEKNINGWTKHASYPFPNQNPNEYYNLKMSFNENKINAYLNDVLLFTVNDPSPLLSGKVGFKKIGGAKAFFDNIVVEENPEGLE